MFATILIIIMKPDFSTGWTGWTAWRGYGFN